MSKKKFRHRGTMPSSRVAPSFGIVRAGILLVAFTSGCNLAQTDAGSEQELPAFDTDAGTTPLGPNDAPDAEDLPMRAEVSLVPSLDPAEEPSSMMMLGIGEITTEPTTVTLAELDELALEAGELSLEELRDQSRTPEGLYLVEGDMLFDSDEQFAEYYYEDYVPRQIDPSGKLIINTTSGFLFYDVRLPSLSMSYCYASGWGGVTGGLAAVQTNLERAMRAWEGVARVKFIHSASLDGTGCTTSGVNPGVSFVVRPSGNTSCTASGPFPSNSWANQNLNVPNCGLSEALATHELGHTLGFRHEHVHSGAMPRCTGEGQLDHIEELTAWDAVSVMGYADCTMNMSIAGGRRLSRLDGVGARKIYFSPDWWWPSMTR